MEEDRRICIKCKVKLPLEHYEKRRSGDYFKQCNQCREKGRLNAQKNKCEHNRVRSRCKECGGSQICEHNRARSRCKECDGSQICEHNRVRNQCKECGGSQICEHNRVRSRCKECGGSSICEHNRIRNQCKECGGSQICEHNRVRSRCKECGGSQICEHNRIRSVCKECGGSQICEHNRERSRCKECDGGSICEHNRVRSRCKECDPSGHLSHCVSNFVRRALKQEKKEKLIEYLGCTIEEFKQHIEALFKEDMTWDNYGDWHIDHITPLKYQNPTIEQVIERLHYKNTQPLWATENISKGNRFIG